MRYEPKISVIMGIYNCTSTLSDAIDSVLKQTYSNWELIMCDDGSTDKTYEIAEEYRALYPDKIILLRNEKNMKLPFTLNRCSEYVTGDYIARMDGDDKSYPERFKTQVEFLEHNPDIDLVGTAMTRFDGDKIIGNSYGMVHPDSSIIGLGTPFNHATIMMKTSVFRDLGGYSEQPYAIRCEDIDLWIRFFAAGYRGENIANELYYVREDLNSLKRRKLRDGFRTTKMLWNNFRKYHYPYKQYLYIIKPILACLTPNFIKYYYYRSKGLRS